MRLSPYMYHWSMYTCMQASMQPITEGAPQSPKTLLSFIIGACMDACRGICCTIGPYMHARTHARTKRGRRSLLSAAVRKGTVARAFASCQGEQTRLLALALFKGPTHPCPCNDFEPAGAVQGQRRVDSKRRVDSRVRGRVRRALGRST